MREGRRCGRAAAEEQRRRLEIAARRVPSARLAPRHSALSPLIDPPPMRMSAAAHHEASAMATRQQAEGVSAGVGRRSARLPSTLRARKPNGHKSCDQRIFAAPRERRERTGDGDSREDMREREGSRGEGGGASAARWSHRTAQRRAHRCGANRSGPGARSSSIARAACAAVRLLRSPKADSHTCRTPWVMGH